MNKKSKWLALTSIVASGGMLFQGGCLQGFWQGFFNTGWPNNNRWLNIAIDIIKEDIFF